jgi:DNA-binding response OmpR family regulator
METAITGWGAKVILAAGRDDASPAVAKVACDRTWRSAICDRQAESQGSIWRELRQSTRAWAVLLVSADISEEAQAAARSAGFPLLKQPMPPGRLRAALRTLLPTST